MVWKEVSVTSESPELGKGIFGYRKSAVNQILADRDIMLRQAEGRVRAAESKVAELETELVGLKDRNTRMDEQLDRLRTQLDALAARESGGQTTPDKAAAEAVEAVEAAWDEPAAPPDVVSEPGKDSFPFGEPAAEYGGLDGVEAGAGEADVAPLTYEPPVAELCETPVGEPSIFDETPEPQAEAEAEPVELHYEMPSAEPGVHQAWMGDKSEREEGEGVDDFVYGSSDYSFQAEEGPSVAPVEPFSFPYEPDQFGDQEDELPPMMIFEEPATGGVPSEGEFAPADHSGWDMPESEAGPGASALAEAAEAAAAAAAAEAAKEAAAPPAEPEPVAQATAPEPSEPAPAQAVASGVSSETIDLTNRFLTDEIQGILAAAEESAARIVERARATTQHQIAQSNRLWREVQAEVSRFATWREQVEPVIRSVQAKVESVRGQIEEVPDRIRQALAPMADTISSVDADLAELAAASTPPLLLTPRGLDSESEPGADWTYDESPEAASGPNAESESPATDGEDSSGHMAG
jgi:hypothetical protein